VRKGEVEGRVDSFYYDPQFKAVIQLKNLVKYPVIKISNLSYFVTDGIHKTPSYSDDGLPFLQANNIKEGIIDFNVNVKRVSTNWQNEVLKRYTPRSGDVLITKDGTIGIAATVPDSYEIFSIFVSVLAIRPRREVIIPEYLRILISSKLVQKQIVRSTKGAVLSHLLLEETKELKIPVPPLETQAQIVALFESAYTQKRAKEAQAKALLAGIDGYLLEALGIRLPPPTERKKFFYVRASQVSGGRFDAFYYQSEFEENLKIVKKGKYKVKPLRQLAQKLVKGKLPKDQEKDGICKVVQINSIREYGNIDVESLLTAKKIFTNDQKMLKNDVLVVITGATIGKIAVWEKESEDYFLGGDIIKFQCLKSVNPYFTFSWLRSKNSQIEIKRNITGATNGHLSPSDVGKFLVPLPPLPIQTKIATHITAIRAQAKQLEQEAKEIVEQAKQQVEKMILGE
jgi:type I restriction enzyme M protein